MDNETAARDWWSNTANDDFQHVNRGYVEKHEADWDAFLPRFNWTGKTVLDYGIGGGYLGERLLQPRYSIGSYCGVDISNVSIDAARRVLGSWSSKVHLFHTPQSFASIRPTIFCHPAGDPALPVCRLLAGLLGECCF